VLISLRQLRYVVSVAQTGSISTASRNLNISQSSILGAIDAAEADLGARIFLRQRARGITMTAAGERYMVAARRLLDAERDFNGNIRDLGILAAPLRIGCFEPFGSIMMVDVLSKLRDRLGPLDITLIEADQPSLKRYLDRGEVDILVVYDLGPDFTGDIRLVGRAPPHAMVSTLSPLAAKEAISMDELADEPIVLLSQPLTVTYLMTLFDYAKHRPHIAFRSRSYETVIRAVREGFGSAILNAWPVTPLPSETGTRRVRIINPLPGPNIITVDHYGNQKPAGIYALIEVLSAHLQSNYHGL
jgi:DNA-binding transcriptional LysR family regulator